MLVLGEMVTGGLSVSLDCTVSYRSAIGFDSAMASSFDVSPATLSVSGETYQMIAPLSESTTGQAPEGRSAHTSRSGLEAEREAKTARAHSALGRTGRAGCRPQSPPWKTKQLPRYWWRDGHTRCSVMSGAAQRARGVRTLGEHFEGLHQLCVLRDRPQMLDAAQIRRSHMADTSQPTPARLVVKFRKRETIG